MLNKEKLMEIALNACVNMLGEDLVNEHKELCCCTCGMKDDGLFHYNLGLDTADRELNIGGETPMEFYAFVVVDPVTGKVTKDYKSSILPN